MSERIIERIVPICEPIIKNIRELTRVYIDLFVPSVNQNNRDEIRAIRYSYIADLEPHLQEYHRAIESDLSTEHLRRLIRFIQDEVQSEISQYTKEWNDHGTTEQKTAIPIIIGIFDSLRIEISRFFHALVEMDED